MPGPPPPFVISTSDQGASIALVHLDHTVDVYQIPPGASITIQPQAGFGSVTQTASSVSLAAAVSEVQAELGQFGAQ